MYLVMIGLRQAISEISCYSKIKGNSIHIVTCFLGLHQHNNIVVNIALLDLVFTNIRDLSVCISSFLMVDAD
jgi:hypothetical protein